jgi:hypothetical protein
MASMRNHCLSMLEVMSRLRKAIGAVQHAIQIHTHLTAVVHTGDVVPHTAAHHRRGNAGDVRAVALHDVHADFAFAHAEVIPHQVLPPVAAFNPMLKFVRADKVRAEGQCPSLSATITQAECG